MCEPKALGSLISITNSLPMHNDGSEESKIRDETVQNIERVLSEFIAQADLYSKTSSIVLENLLQRLTGSTSRQKNLEKLTRLVEKIAVIQGNLDFIRHNAVPRSRIQLLSDVFTVETMEFPKKISCVSIFFSEKADETVDGRCIAAIKDKTPVLLSSRTFASIATKLQPEDLSDNAWFIYLNASKDVVVCLPKASEASTPLALERIGYNASDLTLTTFSELQKNVLQFEGVPNDVYLDLFSEHALHIFTNSQIKKRICFFGHGISVSAGDAQESKTLICGLPTKRFRFCIDKLEQLGLEYCNCLTCFGGGRNLIKAFGNKQRPFTVSMCSSGDFPTLGFLHAPKDSTIKLNLTNTALFWNHVNSALARGEKEGALRAEWFSPALENMYGYSISGLPVISIKGEPHFLPVNVNQRAAILDFDRLPGREAMSKAQPSPFLVQEEACFVYPQTVAIPICIAKSQTTDLFPVIVPKIPDDGHLLLSSIQARGGSFQEVVFQSLLFDSFGPVPYITRTNRVIAAKELTCSTPTEQETYVNVVAASVQNKKFCLFQKKNDANTWFILKQGDHGITSECIDPVEARLMLCKLSHTIRSTTEAYSFVAREGLVPPSTHEEVLQWYKEQFELDAQKYLSVFAFEKMYDGDYAAVQKIVMQLDKPSLRALLAYAVQKNDVAAVRVFRGRSIDIYGNDPITGMDILYSAVIYAGSEIVEGVLEAGGGLSSYDMSERCGSLHSAIALEKDETVRVLCSKGASTYGALECCFIEKQAICFQIVVKYCTHKDFSKALKYVIGEASRSKLTHEQTQIVQALIKIHEETQKCEASTLPYKMKFIKEIGSYFTSWEKLPQEIQQYLLQNTKEFLKSCNEYPKTKPSASIRATSAAGMENRSLCEDLSKTISSLIEEVTNVCACLNTSESLPLSDLLKELLEGKRGVIEYHQGLMGHHQPTFCGKIESIKEIGSHYASWKKLPQGIQQYLLQSTKELINICDKFLETQPSARSGLDIVTEEDHKSFYKALATTIPSLIEEVNKVCSEPLPLRDLLKELSEREERLLDYYYSTFC